MFILLICIIVSIFIEIPQLSKKITNKKKQSLTLLCSKNTIAGFAICSENCARTPCCSPKLY